MKIRIVEHKSTELEPQYNQIIQTIDILPSPIGSGGFGDIFDCSLIDNKRPHKPVVIKIAGQGSYNTIRHLQEAIIEENKQRVTNPKVKKIENIEGLKALPLFSFKGIRNGQTVFGCATLKLLQPNYCSFADYLDNIDIVYYNNQPLEQRLSYCYQLAEVFEALYSMTFIHADLNPANLFISKDNIVLIDFDGGAIAKNNVAPIAFGKRDDWLAPEIWKDLHRPPQTLDANIKSDLWSFTVGMHCNYSAIPSHYKNMTYGF